MLRYLYLFFVCSCLFSQELIVNGSFATGDFTGWTTDQLNSKGSWFVYSGNNTPLNNFPFFPPPSGAYAAITDQNDRSSIVLYQDVTLPSNFPCVLSLIYYYKNPNDDTRPQPGFFNPPSLIDIDNPQTNPNQQLRIDIMTSTSEPFSVESKDVLENLFNTPPGTPLEKGYTTLTADLSKYAGQTIRLRFACADNLYFLLFGIDNVSIQTKFNADDAALKAFSRFSPIKPQRG